MNLFSIKKAYLVGIKGSGLSALACILKSLGIRVVGSDTKEKFFTDEVLKRAKIKFYEGFTEKNLKKELPVDIVITSVAYLPQFANNPEINLARKLNIPILTYPQALAQIFNQSFGIAICGSHGKSSTTAILGKVFKDAGYDPTVLVGSEVIDWQSNALVSKNFRKKIEFLVKNENKLNKLNWLRKHLKKLPIFIIEADEYRDAFLNYYPRVIIITNIDYDHPDYFKTEKDYRNSFKKFIKNLKEPKLLITYNLKARKPKAEKLKSFLFPLPGSHWQKNLNLIYQLIKILKIPERNFIASIKTYKGLKRRFEIIAHKTFGLRKSASIYLIDDYAHHPTEVLAYFESLKKSFPEHKIFFIFQPHTFTRTHFLFNQFVKVFQQIKKDKNTELIIFKTFPSAREKEIIVKIKNLKKDIDLAKKVKALYFSNEKELINYLCKSVLNPYKSVVITTVGAGDGYKILAALKSSII